MSNEHRDYQPLSHINLFESDNALTDIPTKQFFLPPTNSYNRQKQRQRFPLYNFSTIDRFKMPPEQISSKISSIQREFTQLKQQVSHHRNKNTGRKGRFKYAMTDQVEENYKKIPLMRLIKTKTEPEQAPEPNDFWRNPDVFLTKTRKQIKLYKLKLKKGQASRKQSNLPVISRITIKSPSITNKPYFADFAKSRLSRTRYNSRLSRSFRRAAHAILFTIYLRTFNERMRKSRQIFFQRYSKQTLQQDFVAFQYLFMGNNNPFYSALISQSRCNYSIAQNEESMVRRGKIGGVRGLMKVLLDCIQKSIRSLVKHPNLKSLLYYLCKHGSYAPHYQLLTSQELNIICLSEKLGYLRADKYLEQSSLLMLVFIKIFLFNTLLSPEQIPFFASYPHHPHYIFQNLKIVANILYQVLIDIQDDYLERAPSIYVIGNYKSNKLRVRAAKSMTLTKGVQQDNQLITGLSSHKYIKEAYGTKFMLEQRNLLQEMIETLHGNIGTYHQRIRQNHF